MCERVGFIGLGHMGQPIALNLLKAGYDLCVYDICPEQVAPFIALGGRQAERLADAVEPGGIVLTMVPDDAVLEEVALGAGGILERIGSSGVHLSMSTISPRIAQRLESLYARQESHFLAATVLGRPDVAAAARLSIFLSGDHCAKERVLPLLKVLGKSIYEWGEEVAAAPVVKIAANFLILAALEGMGEAAALVEKYGIDRAQFLRMIIESPLFGGAVYEGYGAMIGSQNYQDALFPVPLGLKDASLILNAAEAASVSLPVARIAQDHLLGALRHGWAGLDWSVLSQVIAVEAGLPIVPPGRVQCTESRHFAQHNAKRERSSDEYSAIAKPKR